MKKTGLLVALLLAAACSTPTAPPPSLPKAAVRLGSVEVDAATRTVIATGRMNQVEGPVELLAAGPAGKLHESVLLLEARPLDLQTALLAVKLKSGPTMQDVGMGPPEGDPIEVWVSWETNGVRRTVRGDSLLWNHRDLKPVVSDWTFTGSKFVDGQYKALDDQNYIATYWDPWAIVNITDAIGGDDDAIFVKRDAVPPEGTPVVVYLRPALR